MYDENVDHGEKLHDDVETVANVSCLGDTIIAGSGCEAAVTSRTRL